MSNTRLPQPRRSMATWIPESPAVPPSGVSCPITSDELALLDHFRRLPRHERQLVSDIVAALADGREVRS